jgi:zinc D-Ala-D-Ala carboxypeptidase
MSFWDDIQYFEPEEVMCPCCGQAKMSHAFMLTLDRMRHDYGAPIIISSGFRCPDYNSQFESGRDGPHTTGTAVDVPVYGGQAHKLIHIALRNGVTGLGIKQHGPLEKRHLHFDTLDALADRPRPWVWTYS